MSTGASAPAQHIRGRGHAHPHCRLTVLGTTDLHMSLLPYDYFSDRPNPKIGLCAIAQRVAAIRAEGAETLLLDNGDLLQGTPMGDHAILRARAGCPDAVPHPAIAAMNAMGYDAAGLGNHDFNYGIDAMLAAYAQARFPVISSNLELSQPTAGSPLPLKAAILERELRDQHGQRHPIRIGVISLLPPETQHWEQRHFQSAGHITPMVETARALVHSLRHPAPGSAGCDLVIALAHTGIAPPQPGEENAALMLAEIDGLDALICGHTHRVFPGLGFAAHTGIDPMSGTLHGKPAIQPGERGSHLGIMTLELHPRPQGGWRLAGYDCRAEPMNGLRRHAPTPEGQALVQQLETILAPHHEATIAHIHRTVGHTDAPLNSFFSLVRPDPALALIAEAKRHYLRDHTRHQGLPLLAAVTPFRAGGRSGPGHYTDVASGALTRRSIADLYLYSDQIHAVQLTGQEVLEWLERAASVFRQITPGRPDQVLLDPDFPAYRFDVIDGVEYEIDLTQPQRYDATGQLHARHAHRIRNLSRKGQPVQPQDVFLMAVSSYRLATMPISAERVVHRSTDCAREILTSYVAQAGDLSPRARNHWRFAPMPQTSVLFDTSPDAHEHLESVGLAIEPAGTGPDGFARFRIHL